MVSPQANVSAIREYNLMMGDNSPTEVEVEVAAAAAVDNRTEAEIHQNVQRLIKKVNQEKGYHAFLM